MPDLLNRIENSEVHNSFDQLFNQIDIAHKLENITQEDEEVIQRLEQVYTVVALRMKSADPYFVTTNVLDKINSQTENIIKNLTNYSQNKDNPNVNTNNILTTINKELEQVIPLLLELDFPHNIEEMDALRDSIVNYKRSFGQHSSNLEKYHKEIVEQKSAIEERLESLNDHVDEAEEKANQAINDAISKIDGFEERFSSKQEIRTNEFNKEQREREKDFNEKMIEVEDNYEKHKEDLDNRTKRYDEKLQQSKKKIEELIGAIGSGALSYGYKKYADMAMWNKWVWQFITVGSFIALIISAFYIIPDLNSETFNWSVFLIRGLITISFGAMAGYSAKQASNSSKEEQENRDLQLKLATIDSYLEGLPNKEELKSELTKEYFSNSNEYTTEDNENQLNKRDDNEIEEK
ncbi:hypothetical protein [Virgibacillus sp. CBA3643]|uniref:hypothetical protein n=1 Tax=Virgibacillus sp. CBA3643 TaxID=2942278 RepID=UPI0035A27D1F